MVKKSELLVRPSNLERNILCPASARLESSYPWVDNPDAERGRRLHDAMALLFQVSEQVAWKKIKANELILDDDRKLLEQCFKVGMDLMPDDPDVIILVEQKLDLKSLHMKGGKPDLVFISPRFKGAVVIDWKFGTGPVGDPEENAQIITYDAGLLIDYPYLESFEDVIVQPSSWREDDRLRSHIFSADEIRIKGMQMKGYAEACDDPDAPVVPGRSQCQFCKHKANCEPHLKWKSLQEEAKETVKKQERAVITQGKGIFVRSDEDLTNPVLLIAEEVVDQAKEKLKLAQTIRVTDPNTANVAGMMSKEIRKLKTLIEERRKEIKAPFWNFGKLIDSEAKKATDPLEEAAYALDQQVTGYMRRVAEAEAKAKAEEEEKRRKAEEAERKAEEERLAKVREAQEAQKRAQEALQKAERLKQGKAIERAKKLAQEEAERAEWARLEALAMEEAQARAERDRISSEQDLISLEEDKSKTTGYRPKEEVTWDIPDLAKVPGELVNTILMPDVKVVDQLIKKGKINEQNHSGWIKITRQIVAARSR